MLRIQKQLAREYDSAKAHGWLPFFQDAAISMSHTPALLMAIASRETNMRNIMGDGGHGFGLMQVDVGSYPQWCRSGKWKDAHQAIIQGAIVLKTKFQLLDASEHKKLSVKGHNFVGANIRSMEDREHIAVSSYNCGLWSYYAYSTGRNIDAYSTGDNYGKDVLARRDAFAELWKADHHV